MKKIFLSLMLIAFAMPMFVGCKKGENDPFISLKSRDGRLEEKWKLTKIEGTSVNPYGNTSVTSTYTYDGTIYGVTYSSGGSASATGTYEMTIDKNGTVAYSESYTPNNGTAQIKTGTGTWYWLNSGKNKSSLIIDGADYLFGGGVVSVDRLSSKELVLKTVSSITEDGQVESQDITYTFSKQ